jgi:hypothetical protein
MKTVEKRLTLVTERGTKMDVTIVVTRGYEERTETINDDGYEFERKFYRPINDSRITIQFGNVLTLKNCSLYDNSDFVFPKEFQEQGVSHCIMGYENKSYRIGISEKMYNEIQTAEKQAIEEAETDENWQKYIELRNKKEKEKEEYYKHVKSIENKMTLKGRSM